MMILAADREEAPYSGAEALVAVAAASVEEVSVEEVSVEADRDPNFERKDVYYCIIG